MSEKSAPRRPDYSFWFADLAATPGLSDQQMRVAMRVGAIGMTPNSDGRRLYFESIANIGRATGVPRRTCQRALVKLVEVGLLYVYEEGGGRGRSTRYALRTNGAEARALADAASKKGATNVAPFQSKGCHQGDTDSGEKGCHEGDTVLRETVSPNAERVPPRWPERVSPRWHPNLQESKESPGADPPPKAAGSDPNPPSEAQIQRRRVMLRTQARELCRESGDG